MYNASNSTPRKGFGQSLNYKCSKCNHKFHLAKKPFMMVCSKCNEVLSEREIIENDEEAK